MASRLEKARQDPDSMKARILSSARKVFGAYGYSGATTRMIAKDVGIDISTLYYHWGEKRDLYEAVIMDVDEEIKDQLRIIENKVSLDSPAQRLELGIDLMSEYFFSNPEATNLIIFSYFRRKRNEGVRVEIPVPEYISNTAVAMGLAFDKEHIPVRAKAIVMAVVLSLLNFISAEKSIRPLLNVERDEYLDVVKETLKFILIPAFSQYKAGAKPTTS